MSANNIEFKLRYNPQLHIFVQRLMTAGYSPVLYITNAKKQQIQVLINDIFVRTDEHFMHICITKMNVLETQYSLRNLYCWRSIDGIRLMGGDGTADLEKVYDEFELNVKRGWIKRLVGWFKWKML